VINIFFKENKFVKKRFFLPRFLSTEDFCLFSKLFTKRVEQAELLKKKLNTVNYWFYFAIFSIFGAEER
jgi:hypothetical protein